MKLNLHPDIDKMYSPERIRILRKDILKMTQAEAGEMLGGGPRAWTKYERGLTRPSASMLRLMFLLHLKPERLKVLLAPSGEVGDE